MAYTQNYSQRRNDQVRFDLMEHIGVLSIKDNGWAREVNIVAWNDGPGKIDIREWDPEHKRMTKGVTLFEDEAERLTRVLAIRYGLIYPSDKQEKSEDSQPQGRMIGEPAGASACIAAEEAAGQHVSCEAAPAAAAASFPEAAACVAETAAQLDAAVPATE